MLSSPSFVRKTYLNRHKNIYFRNISLGEILHETWRRFKMQHALRRAKNPPKILRSKFTKQLEARPALSRAPQNSPRPQFSRTNKKSILKPKFLRRVSGQTGQISSWIRARSSAAYFFCCANELNQ